MSLLFPTLSGPPFPTLIVLLFPTLTLHQAMTKFLTAEEVPEPNKGLTLEERVTRLERRVAQFEAKDGMVG